MTEIIACAFRRMVLLIRHYTSLRLYPINAVNGVYFNLSQIFPNPEEVGLLLEKPPFIPPWEGGQYMVITHCR
jgi:hypothetical protein